MSDMADDDNERSEEQGVEELKATLSAAQDQVKLLEQNLQESEKARGAAEAKIVELSEQLQLMTITSEAAAARQIAMDEQSEVDEIERAYLATVQENKLSVMRANMSYLTLQQEQDKEEIERLGVQISIVQHEKNEALRARDHLSARLKSSSAEGSSDLEAAQDEADRLREERDKALRKVEKWKLRAEQGDEATKRDQKEVDDLTSQVAELRAALRRIENCAGKGKKSRASRPKNDRSSEDEEAEEKAAELARDLKRERSERLQKEAEARAEAARQKSREKASQKVAARRRRSVGVAEEPEAMEQQDEEQEAMDEEKEAVVEEEVRKPKRKKVAKTKKAAAPAEAADDEEEGKARGKGKKAVRAREAKEKTTTGEKRRKVQEAAEEKYSGDGAPDGKEASDEEVLVEMPVTRPDDAKVNETPSKAVVKKSRRLSGQPPQPVPAVDAVDVPEKETEPVAAVEEQEAPTKSVGSKKAVAKENKPETAAQKEKTSGPRLQKSGPAPTPLAPSSAMNTSTDSTMSTVSTVSTASKKRRLFNPSANRQKEDAAMSNANLFKSLMGKGATKLKIPKLKARVP